MGVGKGLLSPFFLDKRTMIRYYLFACASNLKIHSLLKEKFLMTTELSKLPVPDRAERNAFFPSEYSLSVYTSKVTDFKGYGGITPFPRGTILLRPCSP